MRSAARAETVGGGGFAAATACVMPEAPPSVPVGMPGGALQLSVMQAVALAVCSDDPSEYIDVRKLWQACTDDVPSKKV